MLLALVGLSGFAGCTTTPPAPGPTPAQTTPALATPAPAESVGPGFQVRTVRLAQRRVDVIPQLASDVRPWSLVSGPSNAATVTIRWDDSPSAACAVDEASVFESDQLIVITLTASPGRVQAGSGCDSSAVVKRTDVRLQQPIGTRQLMELKSA